MELQTIHVHEEVQCLKWFGLVSALEELLPVKFVFPPHLTNGGNPTLKKDNTVELSGQSSSLQVPLGQNSLAAGNPYDVTVQFADFSSVPFPFRGKSVRAKVVSAPAILKLADNEKELARTAAGPVWSVSEVNGKKHFRSGFILPDLEVGGALKNVLNEERFLEMVPLIHWLRENSPETYEDLPLRACFIFDDPNLHWPRYGYVDFAQIAASAERENYHVSFAMIPLDTWFTHRATAEIFRKHSRQISLAIHGNNHTRQELAQNYSDASRLALLRQAIHRVERFERKNGIPVSRVMIPPHGACSEAILKDLPACGFESACISHGSLRAHNKDKPWAKNVGYLPSEFVAGCPVMPRWGLFGNSTNVILLAAFLKQPIILRGHHQDLKGGIEVLNQLARSVNGLGRVVWSNLTNLSQMNYQKRLEKNICRVKSFGNQIKLVIREETSQLMIEPSDGLPEKWEVSTGNGSSVVVRSGEAVSIIAPGEVSMKKILSPLNGATKASAQFTKARAFARRLLAEGRDRFRPLCGEG